MIVICISEKYENPKNWKQWAIENNIDWPKLDSIYTIRGTERTFKGLGLWLEELINPEIKVEGLSGIMYKEPSFSHKRFASLQGEPLTIGDILENLKAEKLNTGLELVTIGEDDYLNHD